MIEKLEPIKAFNCSNTPQAKMQHHSYHNDCIKKINELVDAVNGILAAQEQYATIYKEDIMPMLMPENEEQLMEDKDLSDKIGKLETELDRTRKALGIAVDALKEIKDGKIPVSLGICMDINDALEQITALEQKESK